MKWVHSLNEKVAASKVRFITPTTLEASAFGADVDLGLLAASPGWQLL